MSSNAGVLITESIEQNDLQNADENNSETSGGEQTEEEQKPTYGYYSIWTLFSEADKNDKFYKNPFMISAIVVGLIFWVLTVISCFK